MKLKQEWINSYITWRNYYNKGRGEFSWIKDTLKDLVYVFAAIFFANNNPIVASFLLICFLGYTLACPLFGWWWDKRKLYNMEADWGINRSGLKHLVKKK
jgi:hypothetical protein